MMERKPRVETPEPSYPRFDQHTLPRRKSLLQAMAFLLIAGCRSKEPEFIPPPRERPRSKGLIVPAEMPKKERPKLSRKVRIVTKTTDNDESR